ncbi:MAG: alpha/beta fold hydrolase, partial [Parvularculaceae bacterium]|nr:alpha/beta fold hydrolase [Parvularculaceae bacterium]
MKKRFWALGLVAIAGAAWGASTVFSGGKTYDGTFADAPELGRPGSYPTGTDTVAFTMQNRTSFGRAALLTGQVETGSRTLSVQIWYPIASGAEQSSALASYAHELPLPSGDSFSVNWEGRSVEGNVDLAEGAFPLVVLSHGYGGWNTQFSHLAEHLASRGYIVASIAHADLPFDGLPSFLTSFGNVLLARSRDQQDVIAALLDGTTPGLTTLASHIDPTKVALIGYSMGGYGAITTAGAPLTIDEGPIGDLPAGAREALAADGSLPAGTIDALVLLAPWSGEKTRPAWSEKALREVALPTLMIAGSEDDVVGFENGARWIFDSLSGTDRRLLVFQNARHNIAGNAFEPDAATPFPAIEFLSEPVWRGTRLNAINQHFITAFLDLHLKGDTTKEAFLDLPVTEAVDGVWTTSP